MALATTLSLCFSLDLQCHERTHTKHNDKFYTLATTHKIPLFSLHKFDRYSLKSSVSSHSSSSSPSTTTTTSRSGSYSFLDDPYRPNRFLSNEELEKLKKLENYNFCQDLPSGSLFVRVMGSHEMDLTTKLLAESFAESMLLPSAYESLLKFLVKQYLIERRAVMPHAVTLVGYFRANKNKGGEEEEEEEEEEAEEEEELAGTVEVCFDKRGANSSPPTPTPPKNSPYICNMTVKKELRRRGIGWNLLKASEELISKMCSSKEVYLHCRMIDSAPFNMYTRAGYDVIKTDSILIVLLLQRRKHLMCKKLSVLNSPLESEMSESEEELSS